MCTWYRRRDSNPHTQRHQDLNLACLPISPLRLATGQREQGVARFPAWPHPVLSDRLDDDYSTTARRLMSTDDRVIVVTFCIYLSSPKARTETRPSLAMGSSGSPCQSAHQRSNDDPSTEREQQCTQQGSR